MLILFKYRKNKQGQYKYTEVDTINKAYATGNSGAHSGHGDIFKAGGSWVDTNVSTAKALKDIQLDLKSQGFKEVDNMHEYHEQLQNH